MSVVKMQKVSFHDLGLIDYKLCWDLQEALLAETLRQKLENRSLPTEQQVPSRHFLLFCEHPHVYTLGKSGLQSHLLADDQELERIQATFYKINRGGDITYHGPGQIVGYPIFDLDFFFNDIHQYLRYLEEAIILTCKDYGLETGRIPGLTGVWVEKDDPLKARKICAFGVRCSRWVTMHGFAFNVNSDLDYFKQIVPCGIEDKGVTSLKKELGKTMDFEEVKLKVVLHLQELFQFGIQMGDNELLPWPERISN